MTKYDDAGELSHYVTFQHFIGETDLVGDLAYLDDSNWEADFSTWAQIRTISGREFYAAGQEECESTHNIKLRRREWTRNPVTMRAFCGGHRYRLLTPPLDLSDTKRYQLIKVAEVWP